jgi:hypothetical protein
MVSWPSLLIVLLFLRKLIGDTSFACRQSRCTELLAAFWQRVTDIVTILETVWYPECIAEVLCDDNRFFGIAPLSDLRTSGACDFDDGDGCHGAEFHEEKVSAYPYTEYCALR